MKKLFNLILLVTTSLLFLSCEKEKYPGAYPYDDIVFYNESGSNENTVTEKDSISVVYNTINAWNKELYPMELWVDNEEIATISSTGYLTGKKEGTVTIYARVMGIHGVLEDSIKYRVKDFLKEYIKRNKDYLKYLGIDRNNDNGISLAEVKETEVITKFINSNFLLTIAPYMPNLKEVSVYADTSSRELDLSMLKLRKLNLHDKCILYARDETLGLDYSSHIDHRKLDYHKYKPFFLNKLILDKTHLEELGIGILPGFPIMDLSEYVNLKSITRLGYTTPSWSSMSIILPENIEDIYMRDATFLGNKTYTKLSSLILENCLPLEIRKENFPHLKEFKYLRETTWKYPYVRRSSLDITTFTISDLKEMDYYILVDTLYLSQSLKNYGSLFALEKYIYK